MTEWLAQYEEDGEVFFRIGRDGEDVVADWIGIARLVARRDGSRHRLEVCPDADPRELAKIERGSVRLLLRHLAGKMAFHGAAVVEGDRAAVLMGRARQGKSTLAAALCARNGVALLSDDAVAIDPSADAFAVTPVEECHWLDAAAQRAVCDLGGAWAPGDVTEEGKRPLGAPRVGGGGRLVAFVDLAFTDGPARVTRVSSLEAMAVLVPQAVRFVLDDPAVNRREVDTLARLVDTVPVFRLERPRDLALLSDSCDLVLNLLRELPAASSDP